MLGEEEWPTSYEAQAAVIAPAALAKAAAVGTTRWASRGEKQPMS